MHNKMLKNFGGGFYGERRHEGFCNAPPIVALGWFFLCQTGVSRVSYVQRTPPPFFGARQTINRAEIQAVIDVANHYRDKDIRIAVAMDAAYVYDGLQGNALKSQAQGWISAQLRGRYSTWTFGWKFYKHYLMSNRMLSQTQRRYMPSCREM